MVKSYYHAMHVGAFLPYQYKINTVLLGWRKKLKMKFKHQFCRIKLIKPFQYILSSTNSTNQTNKISLNIFYNASLDGSILNMRESKWLWQAPGNCKFRVINITNYIINIERQFANNKTKYTHNLVLKNYLHHKNHPKIACKTEVHKST